MAEFKIRTKGNSDPQGKPRVYFTCHPEDFNRVFYNDRLSCFDRICADVFKTQDCAIYYTEDMRRPLDSENIDVDLGRANLFLVPVTLRLMNEPNRAMTVDIAYAKEHNIPILPFLMEVGIDSVYSLPRNFGQRQYITPYSADTSEISYDEKLKKHLGEILISDKTARRVRAAFDAYVFLSYRKKDRRHANELMRLIHAIPGCRDIAIWYDEFLTPGESFLKNIKRAMEQSELFALLVTPNLLEDGNFVMRKEYPAARKAKMSILPAEMVRTDRKELRRKFKGIPDCVYTFEDGFTEKLQSALSSLSKPENGNDPEHCFLIGLAYLEGIDVEVDVERGIELITAAAEAGLAEAMERLFLMYIRGDKLALNYHEALMWATRLVDLHVQMHGEEHHDTVLYKFALAHTYSLLGKYEDSLKINEQVYDWSLKSLGEMHPETLLYLNNLATVYGYLEKPRESFELHERLYGIYGKFLPEDHPDMLLALNNLAIAYGDLGYLEKALRLIEKAYKLRCRILGEEHPATLISLSNLASMWDETGHPERAMKLFKKAYDAFCRVYGKEHPETMWALSNIAAAYFERGDYTEALRLNRQIYAFNLKILGEGHPDTLNTLTLIALSYLMQEKYDKAVETFERLYETQCKYLGSENPETLLSYVKIVQALAQAKRYGEAFARARDGYHLIKSVLGEDNEATAFVKMIYDTFKGVFG